MQKWRNCFGEKIFHNPQPKENMMPILIFLTYEFNKSNEKMQNESKFLVQKNANN